MVRRKKSATVQLKVRVKEVLRSRLERAAKARGVSLNAEMGDRLKRSFETEERLGGPKLVELIEVLARVMKGTGEHAAFFADSSKLHNQGEWLSQPYAFQQARSAVNAILDHYTPPGKIKPPKRPKIENIEVVGEGRFKEDTVAMLTELYDNFGELWARGELRGYLRDREQDDE